MSEPAEEPGYSSQVKIHEVVHYELQEHCRQHELDYRDFTERAIRAAIRRAEKLHKPTPR